MNTLPNTVAHVAGDLWVAVVIAALLLLLLLA